MELSKFVGCLMGLAVGDSLGAQKEGFFSFQEIREIGPRYTDDTAMMIGMAESLIECQEFNGEKMAKRFVENYEREPWRGYGGRPPIIFKMLKKGAKWDEILDRKLYPGGSYENSTCWSSI